jgi:hypothetical protein
MVFLFCCDVISIQYIYSDLDAVSLTVGYLIAKEAYVSQRTLAFIQEVSPGTRIEYNNSYMMFGETFQYKLCKDYKPAIIGTESVTISVSRSAVIGYFN